MFGIDGQAMYIRIFVIVGAGWHADHQSIGRAHVLMGVKDIGRDTHYRPVMLGAINLVDHLISWRFRTVIVKHHFHGSVADENPVVVQMVDVPTFDHARADSELVNVHDWRIVEVPGRVENLTDCAPRIGLCDSAPDHDTINKPLLRNAVSRNRAFILFRGKRHFAKKIL